MLYFLSREGRFSLFGETSSSFKTAWLTMKLTATILLAVSLHVCASGIAQETVSIKGKNMPIEKILETIKKKTNYVFFFDYSVLKGLPLITVDARNEKVSDLLSSLFKNLPLEFSILDQTITIVGKTKNEQKDIQNDTSLKNIPLVDIYGHVADSLGNPIIGATVFVRGSKIAVATDSKGDFLLKNIPLNSTIVVSNVGYEKTEQKIKGETIMQFRLRVVNKELTNVQVTYNTGYQEVPRERITGSYDFIDNTLLNRRVSTDILSKLDGVASSVYFNGSTTTTQGYGNLGITIRGQSTLQTGFTNPDPLIVLDNFPYTGDMKNINPNDIESVSILKDASAASIWGAQSANGVIVITTKKGRLNQKMKVDFNTNFTIGSKPDLFKDRNFLDASDYINAELYLGKQGYYDIYYQYPFFTSLSPVAEILGKREAGQISASDSASQIDALRKLDVRNDYTKYVYQKSLLQQYSLSIRGGSNNLSYVLSVGYDKNKDNLINNGYSRFTVNSFNTYTPVKNLEIVAGIMYTQSNTLNNNQETFRTSNMGGLYGVYYPYAQLAGPTGNHLPISRNYGASFIDSMQNAGYYDWQYRPLDEIATGNNSLKVKDLILRTSIKYQILPFLSAGIQYQNETQTSDGRILQSQDTYYARNLINEFAIKNPNGTFTYNFPVGGILSLTNSQLVSDNLRGQINYNQTFSDKHQVTAIVGSEVRQQTTTSYSKKSLGYDDTYGRSVDNLDYSTIYTTNPQGFSSNRLPSSDGSVSGITYRYISYYGNAIYTYDQKYTLSLSGRKDGSNIFGVKENDRIVPLWSVGAKWNIAKETFYSIDAIPVLNLKASYGFNGNVYNGSAYLTANYNTSNLTGAQFAFIQSPPNPELRWERVKIINLGLDFATKRNILSGIIEVYQKQGEDLIEQAPLAPSSGFASFYGNNAADRTNGIDVSLNSKNLDGKFKWYTTLLLSSLKDKATKYDPAFEAATLTSTTAGTVLLGKSLFSILSYRWAGLDPANGDPRGYLNKGISKDYSTIINNASPDSLVYSGSSRPTTFGAFRNTFSYKGFSLSVNIKYEFGFVFRRPTISLNYTDLLISGGNSDYLKRWQKPGDEKSTDVPSLTYAGDPNRNIFYQFSQTLVTKGDNIRLQDINISYDFNYLGSKKKVFDDIQLYFYLNNLGIIWRANKYGIDPDIYNSYPLPKTFSFGVKANF